MIWNPFKKTSKSFLGVDIGTSSIKLVEMSRWGKRKKLENYGEIQAEALYKKPFRTFEKSTLSLAGSDIVRAITAVLKEARISTKNTFFSIPDFSSFFTTFTLPAMTDQELPQAVNYEARQHIPLPLSEVTLDWQIIEGTVADQKSPPLKILLVAVPNEIIQQYQEIARASKLALLALEAEVFGLARALVRDSKDTLPTLLVDIGARSTTISIIDKGALKTSHSFDTAGSDLTDAVARGFRVDFKEAEKMRREYGLLPGEKNIQSSMLPLVDLILNEIQKVSQNYFQNENKEIKKVIMAGGSSLMPGLSDYFAKNLEKPMEIANPFSDVYYPPILEKILKEMGPSYAIAVGTALRGLEEKYG
jgi:type IV pilus assembly protein PilM